jgi:hypothetical protein
MRLHINSSKSNGTKLTRNIVGLAIRNDQPVNKAPPRACPTRRGMRAVIFMMTRRNGIRMIKRFSLCDSYDLVVLTVSFSDRLSPAGLHGVWLSLRQGKPPKLKLVCFSNVKFSKSSLRQDRPQNLLRGRLGTLPVVRKNVRSLFILAALKPCVHQGSSRFSVTILQVLNYEGSLTLSLRFTFLVGGSLKATKAWFRA